MVLTGTEDIPGLADPETPLFILAGKKGGRHPCLAGPSLPPRVEEAHVVTSKGSHLVDKDLRVDIVKVDHVGEGNPHAQESCRRGRRNRSARRPQGSTTRRRPCAEVLTCLVTESHRQPGSGSHYY